MSTHATHHSGTGALPRGLARPALRVLAPAGTIATWAAVGFGVALAAVVTLSAAFGYTSLTVLSGSMEPVLYPGDVVVAKKMAPAEARPGDVVSFRAPDDPSKIYTHRIVRMRVLDQQVQFVTRGDANTGVERWSVQREGTVARVDLRVPKLGYLTNSIGSKFGRLGFLVVPALLLAVFELRRIWRPRHAPRV